MPADFADMEGVLDIVAPPEGAEGPAGDDIGAVGIGVEND